MSCQGDNPLGTERHATENTQWVVSLEWHVQHALYARLSRQHGF